MFHRCHPWRHAYAYAFKSHSVGTHNHPNAYESRRSGGSFGVRRPLRYLGYHLDLDEHQTRRVAAAFDRLKTEREQLKVTRARTADDLADLVSRKKASMDELQEALKPRLDAEAQHQQAIARAVQDISEVLDAEQREQFAALLSSKTLKL